MEDSSPVQVCRTWTGGTDQQTADPFAQGSASTHTMTQLKILSEPVGCRNSHLKDPGLIMRRINSPLIPTGLVEPAALNRRGPLNRTKLHDPKAVRTRSIRRLSRPMPVGTSSNDSDCHS